MGEKGNMFVVGGMGGGKRSIGGELGEEVNMEF